MNFYHPSKVFLLKAPARPHEDPACQCKACEAWDIDTGLRALERALLRPYVSREDRDAMRRAVDRLEGRKNA